MTESVLFALAQAARERIIHLPDPHRRAPSLAAALPGVIAELKPASPSQGEMRTLDDPEGLARALLKAGAAGISALTEPTRFGGSPALLSAAVRAGGPVLMKDFVVTYRQLDLARRAGASAVLLILPLLDHHHSEFRNPAEAIEAARRRGLEVLLEVYDEVGYQSALALAPEIIGINNRDLREASLPVDSNRAVRVLAACGAHATPVLALSGAASAADVRAARRAGAAGVLVGTSLMTADDPAGRLAAMLEGMK